MDKPEWNGAIAIIKKGNYLLMDLRRNKKGKIWEVPGGGIESGETPEEAVKREVKEEVDLDVKHSTWLGAKNQAIHWGHTNIDHYFLINSFSGEPKATDIIEKDTLDVKWVKINEIKNILNVSWRVVDAMYFLSQHFPIFRGEYYRIRNTFDNRTRYSFEQFAYWSKNNSSFFRYKDYLDRRAADKAAAMIDSIEPPILQINPGYGALTEKLIKKFGNVDVVELSPEIRDLLEKKFGDKISFVDGIAENFKSKKKYNGVIALNSFIYQPSYVLFAESLISAMNPKAKLLFSALSIKTHIPVSSYIAYGHTVHKADSYKEFFGNFGFKLNELNEVFIDRLNNIKSSILLFSR